MIESQNYPSTRESQAWIYLHRLYWWNSEQGLLALLLGCRFVNTYVCPCMWKLLFAVPSLGRKIPFNFLFFTNPITCAQKQKIILLLCPQKKKLVPRYWFLPYSARTQSHFWETSLDLENTWYSFKRDLKKPHRDDLWEKKTTRPKSKIIWEVCKKEVNKCEKWELGWWAVGQGQTRWQVPGRCTWKKGRGMSPLKICTLRETCAGSVRALSALHQTLSWALQTLNAHHSEKQYWLIEGGHRICHANANFGKRDCKLPTQHLCKHINNYLLVRCTVKKSFF